MKLLYVEDNGDAVHPIRRIANFLQHDFLVAPTVSGGLELLAERPYLVLVDMALPDGDALDFLCRARQIAPAVPIIVLTGIATQGEREACFAAGCTDYYVKPVDVEVLMALFRRYAQSKVE